MTTQINSMAFYHADGFVPAWKQATRFAGKDGRIGTLPDVVNARLSTEPGSIPWEAYFTTMTAEYLGYTRRGNRILIVAHGVGPMATLEGVQAAYKHEYGDRKREQRGGRISQAEFRKLESGFYGPVEIVNLASLLFRYQYPFIGTMTAKQALFEPLLKARLGDRWEEYIDRHAMFATQWHNEQVGVPAKNQYGLPNWEDRISRDQAMHRDAAASCNPYILHMRDGGGVSYAYSEHLELQKREMATAFLLSIGGLNHVHFEGKEGLLCDISCHGWSDGTRLLGVNSKDTVTAIHAGPDSRKLIRSHWQKLMRPVSKSMPLDFCALVNIGDNVFTQYVKKGERLDTYEPEFRVTSIELVGTPVEFTTTIGGYHGFFKYGIKEVQVLAPPTANAYRLASEPEIIWTDGNPTHHRVLVQFYKVEADTSQRLMQEEELRNDYSLLMNLTMELVEA